MQASARDQPKREWTNEKRKKRARTHTQTDTPGWRMSKIKSRISQIKLKQTYSKCDKLTKNISHGLCRSLNDANQLNSFFRIYINLVIRIVYIQGVTMLSRLFRRNGFVRSCGNGVPCCCMLSFFGLAYSNVYPVWLSVRFAVNGGGKNYWRM